MTSLNSNSDRGISVTDRKPTYWRVEGSLLELGALRPVGFFTWNARSFSERWARRAGMVGMALARPFAYAASRSSWLGSFLKISCGHWRIISGCHRFLRTGWSIETAKPRADCSIQSCGRGDLSLGWQTAPPTGEFREKNF